MQVLSSRGVPNGSVTQSLNDLGASFTDRMGGHDFGLSAAVTASFGGSALVADEDGPAHLAHLARADAGLYRAKRQGRNRVMTAPESLPELRRCTDSSFSSVCTGRIAA